MTRITTTVPTPMYMSSLLLLLEVVRSESGTRATRRRRLRREPSANRGTPSVVQGITEGPPRADVIRPADVLMAW